MEIEKTTNVKPRPNHLRYLTVLRGMTAEQKVAKALELTATARQLFWEGLRIRYPQLDEAALRRIYLERLTKCHNRNY